MSSCSFFSFFFSFFLLSLKLLGNYQLRSPAFSPPDHADYQKTIKSGTPKPWQG
jgi:hypothetical protein